MRTSGIVLSLASVALLGACGRSGDARPDDALKSDLALAAQVQPYQAQQFVSPNELQQGATRAQAPQYNTAGRAPVYRAPAPVRRTSRASSRARAIPAKTERRLVSKHATRAGAPHAA